MSIPTSALTGPTAGLRLERLGLFAEELQEAIHVGYLHAASCTEHDPRSLPGTLVWGKATGHLRDSTKPRGWLSGNTSNLETVVHPSNSHAVAVAGGTSVTGLEGKVPPRTRTPKGPATSRAVEHNAQLQFGGTKSSGGIGGRETWMLLHYLHRGAEEIRLELSYPLEMAGTQISAWRERILLPAVPFSTDIEIGIPDDSDDDALEIDIDVPRRAD